MQFTPDQEIDVLHMQNCRRLISHGEGDAYFEAVIQLAKLIHKAADEGWCIKAREYMDSHPWNVEWPHGNGGLYRG